MITQLHDTLTEIYQAFKDMPGRPVNFIVPNAIQLNPTNQKPYMQIAFLGTQPGRPLATGGSVITFLIQVNLEIKARTLNKELQGYIDEVVTTFPRGGVVELEGVKSKNLARITDHPTINFYGADQTNTGFGATMTIPFTMRMD